MKKILFAAMALGMCMTSCMNEEFPNAVQYGYINLNVSNDPTLQTRAVQTVLESDLSNWVIETQQGTEGGRIPWSKETAYTAGKYTVYAQSHADEEDWKNDNDDWGAAYYEGTSGEVTVVAGQTADAVVNCGTAKNARLKVQFSLISNFTEYSLTAERELVFNSSNAASALAYYAANEEVEYTFNYKYNGTEKSIDGKISMKGPATENIISIASNNNGTISVTVNYNDTFEGGNSETLVFDAATGTEV